MRIVKTVIVNSQLYSQQRNPRAGRGSQYTVKIHKSVWQFCTLRESKEDKTGFTPAMIKFVPIPASVRSNA